MCNFSHFCKLLPNVGDSFKLILIVGSIHISTSKINLLVLLSYGYLINEEKITAFYLTLPCFELEINVRLVMGIVEERADTELELLLV